MHYPAAPIALLLIADAASSVAPAAWWQPLVQAGGLGAMLLWFMLRVEKRMDTQAKADHHLARAVERSTRAHLLAFAALKSIERFGYHEVAREIIAEIDSETDHRTDESPHH